MNIKLRKVYKDNWHFELRNPKLCNCEHRWDEHWFSKSEISGMLEFKVGQCAGVYRGTCKCEGYTDNEFEDEIQLIRLNMKEKEND